MNFPQNEFSPEDIKTLEPAMKIGILATVNPQGQPHLTMISTLMASSPTQVVWGQFMEGLSKDFIRSNPKTGFLVMSLDKHFWRGKSLFTHTSCEGKEFDFYNNTPLFRYNSYFGLHTVYYMDLISQSGSFPLPMNQVIYAAVKTMIARTLTGKMGKRPIMNFWTQAFFNKLDNLKFLGAVDEDGYPFVIPVIQAQAVDPSHIAFSTGAFGNEIKQIKPGSAVAILALSLQMEDVLVRGEFQGVQRLAGLECGILEIDWIYNSMPPKPMQIYPPLPVNPVTEF